MKKRILSMVTAVVAAATMAGAIPVSAADKADPGKDWVYTAINKTIDGKQIIIPAININSPDAEAINKKLADGVEKVKSAGNCMGLDYNTHRFQNIISILTETYASNGNVYLSPDMIDLDTGKKVTGDELISMTGLTEKYFYEKQTNAISNALWEKVNSDDYTDLYGSTEDKQKFINETIEYFDVNKSAYINESGNITDIVYIRPIDGTLRIVYPIDTGISVAPAEQEPAVTVTLNGTKLEFDQNPVIVDGRTLVPLRKIFEALGASVNWNDSTRTVTSSLGGTTISLTIGSDTMKKNSTSVKLDVPAQIIGDRTMVPVRAVAEAFGVNVGWDDNTKTVIIGGEPEYVPAPQVPNDRYLTVGLENNPISYDLDGDGNTDTLSVKERAYSNPGERTTHYLKFTINNVEYDSDIKVLGTFPEIYITDIDSSDQYMDIVMINREQSISAFICRFTGDGFIYLSNGSEHSGFEGEFEGLSHKGYLSYVNDNVNNDIPTEFITDGSGRFTIRCMDEAYTYVKQSDNVYTAE